VLRIGYTSGNDVPRLNQLIAAPVDIAALRLVIPARGFKKPANLSVNATFAWLQPTIFTAVAPSATPTTRALNSARLFWTENTQHDIRPLLNRTGTVLPPGRPAKCRKPGTRVPRKEKAFFRFYQHHPNSPPPLRTPIANPV